MPCGTSCSTRSRGRSPGRSTAWAYSTPTHGGIVEEASNFSFFPGETISLYIGDVLIGEAAASQRITPLDLFPNSTITDPSVVNFARLLLTLDEDQVAQGGIQIGPASAAILDTAMTTAQLTELDIGDADDMDMTCS